MREVMYARTLVSLVVTRPRRCGVTSHHLVSTVYQHHLSYAPSYTLSYALSYALSYVPGMRVPRYYASSDSTRLLRWPFELFSRTPPPSATICEDHILRKPRPVKTRTYKATGEG